MVIYLFWAPPVYGFYTATAKSNTLPAASAELLARFPVDEIFNKKSKLRIARN